MSLFTNPSQQLTLDDSTYHLTRREQKALEKSWAKPPMIMVKILNYHGAAVFMKFRYYVNFHA